MKNLTLMLLVAIALSSCSSNKKVATSNFDPDNNPYFVKKDKTSRTGEVNDPKIQKKINTIIESHLGISISSIAISPITKTDNGYHWKFLNVRNGSSFKGFSDLKFNSVKIEKNNKKENTQVSDF